MRVRLFACASHVMMPLLVSELTAKLIMPILSALCASTYKKEKPCPWGRKTLKGRYCVGGNIKVILFALILYWREIIEYAKWSLRQTHIVP